MVGIYNKYQITDNRLKFAIEHVQQEIPTYFDTIIYSLITKSQMNYLYSFDSEVVYQLIYSILKVHKKRILMLTYDNQ